MKKIFIVGGGGFARECHLALEVLIKHNSELGLSFGGFLGHNGNTIGTGSVLLPNCKIGDNNKIAPLSAVYIGCKNDCHMLGNPAMKI